MQRTDTDRKFKEKNQTFGVNRIRKKRRILKTIESVMIIVNLFQLKNTSITIFLVVICYAKSEFLRKLILIDLKRILWLPLHVIIIRTQLYKWINLLALTCNRRIRILYTTRKKHDGAWSRYFF